MSSFTSPLHVAAHSSSTFTLALFIIHIKHIASTFKFILALTKQDFMRIYSTLGLGKETITSLQAFRKRHADAPRVHAQFASQPTTVDFAH
ncbi:hypothetical protein BU15DRAFT_45273 [Melanogaster broomeanus]|nr:hypothetical protein BU15DRAFT_45273 [Melanogaster broomeanus]